MGKSLKALNIPEDQVNLSLGQAPGRDPVSRENMILLLIEGVIFQIFGVLQGRTGLLDTGRVHTHIAFYRHTKIHPQSDPGMCRY